MGGQGSGRPRSFRKKTTVEACHVLTVQAFGRFMDMDLSRVGTMTWTRGEEKEVVASISFRRVETAAGLAFRFIYTSGKGENAQAMDYPVQVVKVVPHFGGARWYFLCPLVRDGAPCHHRGEKLYLPPGGQYFGCRTCYGLTYESAQEAHRFDGMYKSLAAEMGKGTTPAEVKYLLWRKKRNL